MTRINVYLQLIDMPLESKKMMSKVKYGGEELNSLKLTKEQFSQGWFLSAVIDQEKLDEKDIRDRIDEFYKTAPKNKGYGETKMLITVGDIIQNPENNEYKMVYDPNYWLPVEISNQNDIKTKAQVHAPKGGVNIEGHEYQGGEFIPKEVTDKLSKKEIKDVKEGKDVEENKGPYVPSTEQSKESESKKDDKSKKSLQDLISGEDKKKTAWKDLEKKVGRVDIYHSGGKDKGLLVYPSSNFKGADAIEEAKNVLVDQGYNKFGYPQDWLVNWDLKKNVIVIEPTKEVEKRNPLNEYLPVKDFNMNWVDQHIKNRKYPIITNHNATATVEEFANLSFAILQLEAVFNDKARNVSKRDRLFIAYKLKQYKSFMDNFTPKLEEGMKNVLDVKQKSEDMKSKKVDKEKLLARIEEIKKNYEESQKIDNIDEIIKKLEDELGIIRSKEDMTIEEQDSQESSEDVDFAKERKKNYESVL